MSQAIVTLKKGEGRLLKSGGAWIFDNEIDSIMGEFENGDIVIVHDFDGYGMGRGFINMNSKIRIRMMTRKSTRRTGDYITIKGGGKKSVKAYMIDEKIPAADRNSIFLLADGSHILWIIGYRISEYYKISPQTTTILQAELNGGKHHGR